MTEIAEASRIDAELSRTDFERVDIPRLLRALIAERDNRGVNGSGGVILECSGANLGVAGDASRLERVFHNLIDNAVSFSPAGAPIEIAISGDDDTVEIAVSDHGPGIPSTARERVFERFHSVRPAGEEFGQHSGLGLAIARTIVEAHFGILAASTRSDQEMGARLIVSLPAWKDE